MSKTMEETAGMQVKQVETTTFMPGTRLMSLSGRSTRSSRRLATHEPASTPASTSSRSNVLKATCMAHGAAHHIMHS